MTTLKLKVSKSKRINPLTKQMGFAARVLTNGTAYFDDIVKDAGRNTTMHKAELRMAFELCMDSVSEMLKQGYIVDLGPIGKIYPSCSSGWYAKEEDMMLADVKPQLYFHAGDEVYHLRPQNAAVHKIEGLVEVGETVPQGIGVGQLDCLVEAVQG